MSNASREEVGEGVETERTRRWALVLVLFALTLGGTYAARLAAATGTPDPLGPDDVVRSAAAAQVRFEGRLDRGAVHVGGDGLVHLELIATGAELPDLVATRRSTDVIVVLDRSGSMGGDPMQKALGAIRELAGQLGDDDRFALVTYANDAGVAIPLALASEGARSRWLSRLNSIRAGGGTNMSSGLDRAHELITASREAGRMSRIVLLSDGHANQGDASPDGLARRTGRAVNGEYVLSTVGVGDGFDERLMTRLADAGTGNFYYVPDVEVLGGIFADEFESARQTVASALEIRVDTPAGIRVVDAAGYPVESHGGYSIVRPGSLYSGQQRSFWVTLRVPSDRAGKVELGDVRLTFVSAQDGRHGEVRLPSLPDVAAVIDEKHFAARLDKSAVETHHVEETINRLRQSVSELVSIGNYAAAKKSLEQVDYDELKAAGYEVEATESFNLVEDLKDEVERAAAAPAAVQIEVRSKLGKSLYEAGTDGRRKGAKR